MEAEVPFTGEVEVFKVRPTTYTMSPPRAQIRNGVIVLQIVGTDLNPERVRSEIERTLWS